MINTPKPIANGARSVNLSATSTDVMVVPILAPIITPIACVKFIIPAFTKPTTITVEADELCTIAVTNAPTATPI